MFFWGDHCRVPFSPRRGLGRKEREKKKSFFKISTRGGLSGWTRGKKRKKRLAELLRVPGERGKKKRRNSPKVRIRSREKQGEEGGSSSCSSSLEKKGRHRSLRTNNAHGERSQQKTGQVRTLYREKKRRTWLPEVKPSPKHSAEGKKPGPSQLWKRREEREIHHQVTESTERARTH